MRKPFLELLGDFVLVLAAVALVAATAVAQTSEPGSQSSAAAPMPGALESAKALMLGHGKIFTFFMVMLGPIKLLGPFAKITSGMDEAASRRLALKGFGIAVSRG